MDLVVTGVVVGVLGTLVMDSLNYIVARTRLISRIDVAMIGRMAAGWARGRFRYANPTEMEQVTTRCSSALLRITPSAWSSRFRICSVGRFSSVGLHHRYGHLCMASQRPWPHGSSFTHPWGWECLAGNLPKA